MKTLAAVLLLALAPGQAQEIAKAEKVLAERPDDPAANATLGIHYAGLADWDRALPLLGKVKSAEIRAAVEAEAKIDPANKLSAVEVADAWVAALPKSGPARQACLDRASFLYASAWGKLDDFWKLKLRERLAKLYRPAAPTRGTITGWGGPLDGAQKVDVLPTLAHSGGGALRLTPNAKKAANHSFLRSATIPAPAGKVLEFSFWILTDGTDSFDDHVRFFVRGMDRKDISINMMTMTTDVPVWQKVSKRVDLDEVQTLVSIEVVSFSSKGFVWIDDLSLKIDGKELLPNGGFEK